MLHGGGTMFDKIFKLDPAQAGTASSYSMPDNPDNATDIDKKLNAKRKPKDKDGNIPGINGNTHPGGPNGMPNAEEIVKVEGGFDTVMKATPNFAARGQGLMEKGVYRRQRRARSPALPYV